VPSAAAARATGVPEFDSKSGSLAKSMDGERLRYAWDSRTIRCYPEPMARVASIANQLLFAALVSGCSSTNDGAHVAAGGAAGANPVCCGHESSGAANAADAGAAGASVPEAGAAGTIGVGGASGAGSAGAAGTDPDAAGTAGTASECTNQGSCSLFNGADLAGWDRYLGKPSHDPNNPEPALGLENDPKGVFSVVMLDGEPAIRVSGEIWGALISKREFCNFRLRAQFKWGTKHWEIKDSGIMFLSTGPLGAVNAGGNTLSEPGSAAFMVSAEYQISPNDVGSLYNLGPVAFGQTVHSTQPENEAWNDVEISLQNDVASLMLNQHEVSRGVGFVLNWPDQPAAALTCGKLQLQSEGGEIFFRHLEIEELP